MQDTRVEMRMTELEGAATSCQSSSVAGGPKKTQPSARAACSLAAMASRCTAYVCSHVIFLQELGAVSA